ncbi:MAG: hypothetical protein LBR79_01575 [Oscillospiraceae bacterium]|nr:hypothetical protein [Oscillospiraceae bacterium]
MKFFLFPPPWAGGEYHRLIWVTAYNFDFLPECRMAFAEHIIRGMSQNS